MEESKPVYTSQKEFPTSVTQNPPRQVRSKLSNVDIQSSSYFKIRSLVRELRPNFIEVLRTPDFRNCEAAHQLREKMKTMIELYKQMTGQTDPLQEVASKDPHFSGKNVPGKQSWSGPDDRKFCELPQSKQLSGNYVVGGSTAGWNFITFCGSRPVYYGATKESFQKTRKKSNHRSSRK